VRVRTFDAELRDPPVVSEGTTVVTVRRLRLRRYGVRAGSIGGGGVAGSAGPAYVLVQGPGDLALRRVVIRDRTTLLAGAVKAAASMFTLARRRS